MDDRKKHTSILCEIVLSAISVSGTPLSELHHEISHKLEVCQPYSTTIYILDLLYLMGAVGWTQAPNTYANDVIVYQLMPFLPSYSNKDEEIAVLKRMVECYQRQKKKRQSLIDLLHQEAGYFLTISVDSLFDDAMEMFYPCVVRSREKIREMHKQFVELSTREETPIGAELHALEADMYHYENVIEGLLDRIEAIETDSINLSISPESRYCGEPIVVPDDLFLN